MNLVHANTYMCPCCGFPELQTKPYADLPPEPVSEQLDPPYSQYFGAPSYDVCPCCGFEYGFDDEPGTASPRSFPAFLADWIRDGALWFSPKAKPIEWSLDQQLLLAGISKPA